MRWMELAWAEQGVKEIAVKCVKQLLHRFRL